MNFKRKTSILCILILSVIILTCSCSSNTNTSPVYTITNISTTNINVQSEILLNTETNILESSNEEIIETTNSTIIEEKEIEITIATYNIKHCSEGIDKIANAIREISPDIIGLEEVDVNCERSGYIDEPKELASILGYKYYVFAKAISLGSGEYGNAILSKYPIESFEVISLESNRGENRSAGHAKINIENTIVDVLITHLSYEDRTIRINQMITLGNMMKTYSHYVLLGDFNCFNMDELENINGDYYVNRLSRRYSTFRNFNNFTPDNIIVSNSFSEITSGISDEPGSDHRLLYASFTFYPNK